MAFVHEIANPVFDDKRLSLDAIASRPVDVIDDAAIVGEVSETGA